MLNIMIAVVIGAMGFSIGSVYVLRLIRAILASMAQEDNRHEGINDRHGETDEMSSKELSSSVDGETYSVSDNCDLNSEPRSMPLHASYTKCDAIASAGVPLSIALSANTIEYQPISVPDDRCRINCTIVNNDIGSRELLFNYPDSIVTIDQSGSKEYSSQDGLKQRKLCQSHESAVCERQIGFLSSGYQDDCLINYTEDHSCMKVEPAEETTAGFESVPDPAVCDKSACFISHSDFRPVSLLLPPGHDNINTRLCQSPQILPEVHINDPDDFLESDLNRTAPMTSVSISNASFQHSTPDEHEAFFGFIEDEFGCQMQGFHGRYSLGQRLSLGSLRRPHSAGSSSWLCPSTPTNYQRRVSLSPSRSYLYELPASVIDFDAPPCQTKCRPWSAMLDPFVGSNLGTTLSYDQGCWDMSSTFLSAEPRSWDGTSIGSIDIMHGGEFELGSGSFCASMNGEIEGQLECEAVSKMERLESELELIHAEVDELSHRFEVLRCHDNDSQQIGEMHNDALELQLDKITTERCQLACHHRISLTLPLATSMIMQDSALCDMQGTQYMSSEASCNATTAESCCNQENSHRYHTSDSINTASIPLYEPIYSASSNTCRFPLGTTDSRRVFTQLLSDISSDGSQTIHTLRSSSSSSAVNNERCCVANSPDLLSQTSCSNDYVWDNYDLERFVSEGSVCGQTMTE